MGNTSDTMKPKQFLNSNLMMPDFLHKIRIRLAQFKIFFVASRRCSVSALLGVSASSNLNSKLFRFHRAHPNGQSWQVFKFLMRQKVERVRKCLMLLFMTSYKRTHSDNFYLNFHIHIFKKSKNLPRQGIVYFLVLCCDWLQKKMAKNSKVF